MKQYCWETMKRSHKQLGINLFTRWKKAEKQVEGQRLLKSKEATTDFVANKFRIMVASATA